MSGPARPRVEVDRSRLASAWDAVAALAIAFMVIDLATAWPRLPEAVPIHFDARGRADGHGPRAWLLALPALATAIFLGFHGLRRVPHSLNYPVAVTEANAARLYGEACALLAYLGAAVAVLFATITAAAVRAALGAPAGLPAWALAPALLAVFGGIAVSVARMLRAR